MKPPIKNILVITLSNLGDVVLTTPVLAVLRDAFKEADISILVGNRPPGLFEGHSWIRRVYVYDKSASLAEKWKLMKNLRAGHFDLAVDLRRTLIPYIIGTHRVLPSLYALRRRNKQHVVDEHLSVLDPLHIPHRTTPAPSFFSNGFSENVEAYAKEKGLDIQKPFIVIAPGARSHIKRWPAERFGLLAEHLHQAYDWPVVLMGDENEKPIAEQVRRGREHFVMDLSGETSIRCAAALIGRSALVVTNDSAALHLADQQDRPVVAIFGPTDEGRYGPRGKRSRILRKHLFCAPCRKAQCVYRHECMQELSEDEVLEASLSLMAPFHKASI